MSSVRLLLQCVYFFCVSRFFKPFISNLSQHQQSLIYIIYFVIGLLYNPNTLMKVISSLFNDDIKAKYKNTQFYFKNGLFLILKSAFIFCTCLFCIFLFFSFLTPASYLYQHQPLFQVKKIDDKSMISMYTNKYLKQNLCTNPQNLQYKGRLYTKQQYCQVAHQNFPNMRNFVDLYLQEVGTNTKYVTVCLIKKQETKSVCQKFAHSQRIKISNDLDLEGLYSLQIEVGLHRQNQFFGYLNIVFEQQKYWITKRIIDYYTIVSFLVSIIMSGVITIAFIALEFRDLMERRDKFVKGE